MDKTILDFTEATDFAADDWVLFDSESGGGCRIKATKIAPVVTGINVTYTQTQTVYADTPLDDLKQDLIVKAVYRGGKEKTVEDYTLSGTLSVGTSTITVSYHGYDETIQVEVTSEFDYLYEWDLTQSLTDKVKGVTGTLEGTATWAQGVGVQVNGGDGNVKFTLLSGITIGNYIYEVDVAYSNFNSNAGGGFFQINRGGTRYFTGIRFFGNSFWVPMDDGSAGSVIIQCTNPNEFNGKTFKFMQEYPYLSLYSNDVKVASFGDTISSRTLNNIALGSSFYDVTITGVRIYEKPTT